MAITQELARLYREHYANRLSLADYRYQRGLLLDSLLPAASTPDVEDEEDVTISRGEREAPEVEPEAEPPTPSRGVRWPAVAGVLVVLFAGTVYVVTTQLESPDDIPTPTAADREPAESLDDVEPLGAPEIQVVPDVGQPLVEAFLEDNDWSPGTQQRFLDAWISLPAPDRIVAKGAVWFAPLADRLEYEIAEAEEFSSVPDSDVHLQQLYATAVGLGLTELAPTNWKPGLPDRSVPRDEAVAVTREEASPAEREVAEDEPEVSTPDVEDVGEVVAETSEQDEPQPEETAAVSVPLDNEDACREEQLQTRRRGCFDLLASGGQGPSMRVIPSGTVAELSVDTPFAISTTEVSRVEFAAYCDATGTECPADPWPGENMPMVNVSREDAEAYCDWLSAETGFTYRLPTEAEWEYAARAGATTEYPNGDEITAGQARYSSITSYDSPLPRDDRTTQRNEFGLWHVVGNVGEWVNSSTDAAVGVTRGGSYADDADGLRLSSRQTRPATDRDAMTGFRVVREL